MDKERPDISAIKELPFVSIVIPTLNSAGTLDACLASISRQHYPEDRYEIIIADAGSSDRTIELAKHYNVTKIVDNPLKTGEAGKSAGIHHSEGELIALIDSDNILPSPLWLRNMVIPFSDPDITGAEPIEYTRREEDPALTRYFAMLGMNDPICLFIGNYDRLSRITGRWTKLNVPSMDCGEYLKLTLSENALPTIGANGFIFRKSMLEHINWSPYFFDIDVVHQAVSNGCTSFAKVKCGIVHLYCNRLRQFARKQDRRIRDFLYFSEEKQRTYPWDKHKRRGIMLFALSTVTIIPLLIQMLRGALRQRDSAWLYHIPVCWITLWKYGIAVIKKTAGTKSAPRTRENWKQ